MSFSETVRELVARGFSAAQRNDAGRPAGWS
jgi:hypothetical protein